MDYEQLVDKLGALLDDLDEFIHDVADDRNTIDANPSKTILQNPPAIWWNITNDLQNILDGHLKKDA